MSTDMQTADGGKVAPEAPQPTHIDVHIHQEPVLGLGSLRCPLASNTTSWTPGSTRLLVASWVVQIVLGLLSCILGGFGCILRFKDYWYHQSFWAAGIWAGAVAALAGVAVFIYEKRGGIWWALLRSLLALAAFSTAIAAIYTGADYFYSEYYYFSDELCVGNRYWGATVPPGTPEEANRRHLCLLHLQMLMTLFTGLGAMLLSVFVLLLLASLVPLFLWCWRRLPSKEWSPSPDSPCPRPCGPPAKDPRKPEKPITMKRDHKTLLGASEVKPCLS